MIERNPESNVRAVCFAISAAIGKLPSSQNEYRRLVIAELHNLVVADLEIRGLLTDILSGDRTEMERLVIKWMNEFGFYIKGDPLTEIADLLAWFKARDQQKP